MRDSAFGNWIRMGASIAGLASGAIAIGRALGGAGFLTSLYQSAGLLGVAYLACSVPVLAYLAWSNRQQPLRGVSYGLGTIFVAFSLAGWVTHIHDELNETAGAIVGVLGLCGVILYYAVDVAERQAQGRKSCPDCCETVKAAARVCRFCGYRFHSEPAP